jgi:hypothetical protein
MNHTRFNSSLICELRSGNKTLGIEVTQFYLKTGDVPESEQRQRPLREAVIRSAQDLYRATSGNIELSFAFNPTIPITTARRKVLSVEIANIAKGMDAQACSTPGSICPASTIPELENIFFTGDHWPDPYWRIFQVSTLATMSHTTLEAIVREKEIKSLQYKKCSANWLLIIVDWADHSQNQEIRLNAPKIESKIFEKIIVYKWGYNHIIELKKKEGCLV